MGLLRSRLPARRKTLAGELSLGGQVAGNDSFPLSLRGAKATKQSRGSIVSLAFGANR